MESQHSIMEPKENGTPFCLFRSSSVAYLHYTIYMIFGCLIIGPASWPCLPSMDSHAAGIGGPCLQ